MEEADAFVVEKFTLDSILQVYENKLDFKKVIEHLKRRTLIDPKL